MRHLLALGLLLLWANSNAQGAGDSIVGFWYNQEKSSIIEIYKASIWYSGKVVWLEVKNDTFTGKPRTDKFNPNEEKRKQPLIGRSQEWTRANQLPQ